MLFLAPRPGHLPAPRSRAVPCSAATLPPPGRPAQETKVSAPRGGQRSAEAARAPWGPQRTHPALTQRTEPLCAARGAKRARDEKARGAGVGTGRPPRRPPTPNPAPTPRPPPPPPLHRRHHPHTVPPAPTPPSRSPATPHPRCTPRRRTPCTHTDPCRPLAATPTLTPPHCSPCTQPHSPAPSPSPSPPDSPEALGRGRRRSPTPRGPSVRTGDAVRAPGRRPRPRPTDALRPRGSPHSPFADSRSRRELPSNPAGSHTRAGPRCRLTLAG
ncbi:extensin-like [Pteropus vampyrus]|uniref:Extensin-like n=1 Tax=Pteropus vampyrus TaxID=132908 RepID=A0A6P6CTV2_PTEVA|nr:extensin-like [Pteropus vampyrus]